jgi:hypothetical protein
MLASRHHITIQLQDRLPAPLRDVNNSDQDHLPLCDPSSADPPVWILPFESFRLLQVKTNRNVSTVNDHDRRKFQDGGGLTSKNLHTAPATRLANLSTVIVL